MHTGDNQGSPAMILLGDSWRSGNRPEGGKGREFVRGILHKFLPFAQHFFGIVYRIPGRAKRDQWANRMRAKFERSDNAKVAAAAAYAPEEFCILMLTRGQNVAAGGDHIHR